MLDDVVTMVLAGGVGERLYPLTKDRAKPAVYFGGPYRIIDFTLSNCLNSGLRKIFIALQYKSLSLTRHLRFGWSVVADELGEFIEVLHPQKRVGEHWYQGTADAVYQNLYSIQREEPRHLIVLSGDHVYKMDYARMLRFHRERGAGATLAVHRGAGRRGATASASCRSTSDDRLTGFLEKPKDLPPGQHLASMGIYIFDMNVLVPALEADAREATSHDFGKDIIPALIVEGAGLRLPLHRREQEDDEVLARHRHARRLLRSQHGSLPRQPGVQPLRSGMAGPHPPGAGAAGEVRLRRRRDGAAGTRSTR